MIGIKKICIFTLWFGLSGLVMGFTIPPTIIINNSELKNSNMNTEIFKDVIGFEGFYQISNLGNVRSIDRIVKSRWGTDKPIRSQLLAQSLDTNKKPYYKVVLSKNGNKTSFCIHRLVAEAFISNPENKKTVNHINGIKSDNSVSNLEWNTHSENVLHSYKNGLQIAKKHTPETIARMRIIKKDSKPSKEALCKSAEVRKLNGIDVLELTTDKVYKLWSIYNKLGIHIAVVRNSYEKDRPIAWGKFKGMKFKKLNNSII